MKKAGRSLQLSVVFDRTGRSDDEFDSDTIQRMMSCIGQYDFDLVPAGGQADEDKWLATRIGPVPRRIVDDDMDMAEMVLNVERIRTEDWLDPQILRTILNEDEPVR